ncbi:MAG: hypothetical protein NSGCLCUN01_03965 [uncultured Clostridium sp.]
MGLKILENQIEILVKEQEAYIGIEFNNSYSKVLELSKGIAELIDLKHKIEKERALYPYNIKEGIGIIAGISGVISSTTNCDENNMIPIFKERHEMDNFIEYLNEEENELKKFISEIESKGNEMTVREEKMKYGAETYIEKFNSMKFQINEFKKYREHLREKYQK